MGKPTLIGLEALLELAAKTDNVPATPPEFSNISRQVCVDSIPHSLSLCCKYSTGEWLHSSTINAMRRRLQESSLETERLQYAAYLVHMVTMRAYEKSNDPADKRLTTH